VSKIKLNVESLHVESFATAAVRGRGTVVANAAKTYDGCSHYCPSVLDDCPSAYPAATLPCNGCVGTELCL
jgi:hypothetical protein